MWLESKWITWWKLKNVICETWFRGSGQKQAKILAFHPKSYDYEIPKLLDVAKERYELFMETVNATKESLALKVSELKALISKEVMMMEENYNLLHGKVDVIVSAITRQVEFNNEYTKQFEARSEEDKKMFEKMEEFLSGIKETLSKFDLLNQWIISQESLSQMVSNIESNIKTEVAAIRSLVFRLPTNAPRAT